MVEHLLNKNSILHCWSLEELPPATDAVMPEYTKSYYVKGLGKTTTWEQIEKQQLAGVANLEGLQQLQDASKFMEGLGYNPGIGSVPSIENVKHALLTKELDTMRSTCIEHLSPQPLV